MQHNIVSHSPEQGHYLLLSSELPLAGRSHCQCRHLHILHEIEMAKRSGPAAPESVMVLIE